MSRYAIFTLPALLYLTAVCQTAVNPTMAIRDAAPNWFLLLAAGWVFAGVSRRGSWVVAAGIGLGFDLTSMGTPGLGLAMFGSLALGLEWLARQWSLDALPVRCGLLAAAAVLVELAVLISALVTGSSLSLAGGLWLAIRCAVYTAGVAIPLLMILSWLPNTNTA